MSSSNHEPHLPLAGLDPQADHRYQIGRAPVFLSITTIDGKPRLQFVQTAERDGSPVTPPDTIHLATFRGPVEAQAVVAFLDELVSKVNDAIEHYEKLSERYAAFHPSPESHYNGHN